LKTTTTFCLLFLLFFGKINSQIINADLWKLRNKWGYLDFERANTARFSMYMLRSQKRTILYMNLARQNGPKFTELVIKPYIAKYPEKEDFYIQLRKKDIPMLYPSFRLWLTAAPHAFVSGLIGSYGHQAIDLRMASFLNLDLIGENCSYGYFKGLDVTLQLLKSSGHRRNILNKKFSRTAVCKMPHIKDGWNSVSTFSGPKFSDIIFRDHCEIKHLQFNLGVLTDFQNIGFDFLIGQRKNHNVSSARWAIGSEFILLDKNILYAPKLQWASAFYYFSLGCNFVNYIYENKWGPVLRPEISFRLPFTVSKKGFQNIDLDSSKSSIGISYAYNLALNKNKIPIKNHVISITYSKNFLFKEK